ncbi:branched-chain amino acid ABC transporter permease [soil metagenome]
MLASALVSGLALGSMYGLIALGFHVTYAVSGTVNFAQGSSVMLGAVLTYAFSQGLGWPWPLAIVAALVLGAAYGVIVEFIAVRPFASRGSDAWLMATVASGIVLDNVVMFTFGKEPRNQPSPLSVGSVHFGADGLGVSPLQIVIPIVGLGLAALLHSVARHTRFGVAMLATSQNKDAARLMGIPVRRVTTVAFAVSTLFACMAGALIAPLATVHSEMGMLFGLKAFAAAILGGISSAWGVMLAGLLLGLVETATSFTLGSGYTQIISFALVIAVLAMRPDGLFGRAVVRKV